jgi:hypothetical protein
MLAYDTSPSASPVLDSYYDSDSATPRPGDYFSELHDEHQQSSNHPIQQHRTYQDLQPLPIQPPSNIHFINPFQQRPDHDEAAYAESPISPATTTSRPPFHHTSTAPLAPSRYAGQSQSFSQPGRPSFHHQDSAPEPHHQQRQCHSLSSAVPHSRAPSSSLSGTPHKINRTPSGFFRPSPSSIELETTISNSSFSSSSDSSFDQSLLTPGTTPLKSYFSSSGDQLQQQHRERLPTSNITQKPSLSHELPVDPFAAQPYPYAASPTSYILSSESSGLIYLSEKKSINVSSPPRTRTQTQHRSHPYSPEVKNGRMVVREETKVAVDRRIDRRGLGKGRMGFLQPAGLSVKIKQGRKYCHF